MPKHPHEPHRWAHPDSIKEDLIIKPTIDLIDLRQQLKQRGALLEKTLGHGALLIRVQGHKSEALAADLLKAGLVEYAHPAVQPHHAGLKPSDTQWIDGLEQWESAWAYQTGGSVSVAVLDTGCTTTTDCSTNILAGRNIVAGTTDVTDSDGNSHGTASCSLIAADWNNGATGAGVAGLGAGIKVIPVKCANSGGPNSTNLGLGIDWVVADGRAKVITMQVFSSSAFPQSFIDSVNAAFAAGLIIVCSAGNTDSTTTQYPAGHDHIVAVAGCYGISRDRYFAGISGGSTYGSWTDTAGHYGLAVSEIQKAYDKTGALVNYQGTSASAPALAAAIALLWSFKPTASQAEILDSLINYGDPVTGTDWGAPPHPSKALNVYRSIDSLRSDARHAGSGAFARV